MTTPAGAPGDQSSFDREILDDTEKLRALARLRERYGEARDLVSSAEPCANLDWVLGAKGKPGQRPADLDDKMMQLVTLWLQDLAAEVDSALPSRPAGEPGEEALLAHQARRSIAANLRAATEGFLAAFRLSS